MTHETSCGAVVFNREGGRLRYVLIRDLNGIYGFPKGHMEPGETEEETALREILEETGLHVRLLPGFRVTDEYLPAEKPGVMKRVVYFLAEYEAQEIVYQRNELSGASLTGFEKALGLFQYESSGRILTEANEWLLSHPEDLC